MRFIAHRGNLRGPKPELENRPEYLAEALNAGYDVETDVWEIDGQLMLGHDRPEHRVEMEFLKYSRVWCHAKNLDALLRLLRENCHVFSHDHDDHVLTSRGVVWAYPGKPLAPGVVCVMPERAFYSTAEIESCYGVCSDRVEEYRERFSRR